MKLSHEQLLYTFLFTNKNVARAICRWLEMAAPLISAAEDLQEEDLAMPTREWNIRMC